MINIDVYSEKYVEIESEKFEISTKEQMTHFIKTLLNKAYYAGEKLCLEEVTQNIDEGKNYYDEIDRW